MSTSERSTRATKRIAAIVPAVGFVLASWACSSAPLGEAVGSDDQSLTLVKVQKGDAGVTRTGAVGDGGVTTVRGGASLGFTGPAATLFANAYAAARTLTQLRAQYPNGGPAVTAASTNLREAWNVFIRHVRTDVVAQGVVHALEAQAVSQGAMTSSGAALWTKAGGFGVVSGSPSLTQVELLTQVEPVTGSGSTSGLSEAVSGSLTFCGSQAYDPTTQGCCYYARVKDGEVDDHQYANHYDPGG